MIDPEVGTGSGDIPCRVIILYLFTWMLGSMHPAFTRFISAPESIINAQLPFRLGEESVIIGDWFALVILFIFTVCRASSLLVPGIARSVGVFGALIDSRSGGRHWSPERWMRFPNDYRWGC